MNKKIYTVLLLLTATLVSGCFEDYVKKHDIQVLEASMTRRLNTLNYDLNIIKGATNENRSDIEILQQQLEEVSKRIGMITENIQKVGNVENKFNTKLKTMMDEVVRENERLIKEINKARTTTEAENPSGGLNVYNKSSNADLGTGFYHTVQSGESISKIAKNYNVPIEDLIKANNIDNPDSLYIGQDIFIPSSEEKN